MRIIDPKSDEAWLPKVVEAKGAEMENMIEQGVFNLREVMEWEEAKRLFPDAVVVGSRMILAEKNSELLLPYLEKVYKGRLVAQGNYMMHTTGKKLYDDVEHDEPI